jgi:hypothetical protein
MVFASIPATLPTVAGLELLGIKHNGFTRQTLLGACWRQKQQGA